MNLTEIEINENLCKNTNVKVIVEQTLPDGKKAHDYGELSWCKHENVWEVYVSSFHSYYPDFEALPTKLYMLPK